MAHVSSSQAYLHQEFGLDAVLGLQSGGKLPEHIYEASANGLALLFRILLALWQSNNGTALYPAAVSSI